MKLNTVMEITGLTRQAISKAVREGEIRVVESVMDGANVSSYTYDSQSVHLYKSGLAMGELYTELHNKCTNKWVMDDIRANQEEYHCKIYSRA